MALSTNYAGCKAHEIGWQRYVLGVVAGDQLVPSVWPKVEAIQNRKKLSYAATGYGQAGRGLEIWYSS
jgi:hypothetical protein